MSPAHESSNPDPQDAGGDQQPSPPVTAKVKPRVWPLFVLSGVELAFAAVLQGIAILVILWLAVRSGNQSVGEAAESLPAKLMHAPNFVVMLVLSGLSMIAGGLLFGWISARNQGSSVVDRLGLRWPTITGSTLVGFLLGSVPVLLVSVGVVILIEQVIPGDESVLELYKNVTNGWAIVLIVVIGVLPGFGEELFFRGFIQRRMLERYRPSIAIGVTSLIFGLFHVTPHGIALATIIGVWLGVIAWRTNSIWPSALCHAFINSGWNIYQVGRFKWGIPDIPPIWFCVLGGAIVLTAFAWSVRWLIHPQGLGPVVLEKVSD